MKGSVGRRESTVYRGVICVILVLGALPILLPVYWLVLAGLKSRERMAVSPPDWWPVDVRHTVRIADQDVAVTIFDDASTSQTGVYRVKMRAEDPSALRLASSDIERVDAVEYSAQVGGVERRVEPLVALDEIAEGDAVPVRVPGMARTALVAPEQIEVTDDSRTYWVVLGAELPVTIADRNTTSVTVAFAADAPLIQVAPELYSAEPPAGVRWRERRLPARVVTPLSPAGYLTIQLLAPPGGVTVPVDELREETRVRRYALIDGARTEVKPLEPQPDGQLLVELPGQPRVLTVSKNRVQATRRTEYVARILDETRAAECVETEWPQAGKPVTVFIPGAIAVAATQVRTATHLRPRWDNFARAWREQRFDLYVVNTLFIAALVVLGTVLSCGLVGYAFARLEFRGRDALFLLLLATMMIPGQVTSIPTFVLYVKFGWIDTYQPLIVPHFLAGSAFFVFLFRQFMLTIPSDLEDAARIDGCGPLATWWLVMMPLSKPIIVTVAVFAFTGVWNDFLGPLLYINSDEKQTVALGLQSFKSTFSAEEPQLMMAASVLMIVPTVILFFLAQKAFIRGVVVSGVKG